MSMRKVIVTPSVQIHSCFGSIDPVKMHRMIMKSLPHNYRDVARDPWSIKLSPNCTLSYERRRCSPVRQTAMVPHTDRDASILVGKSSGHKMHWLQLL